jgi:hypothetical protein
VEAGIEPDAFTMRAGREWKSAQRLYSNADRLGFSALDDRRDLPRPFSRWF